MSPQDYVRTSSSGVSRKGEQQRRRQEDASQRTREELDHLIVAMQRLEGALASPAPTREHRRAARAKKELALVRESLEAHILSAEGQGGLFAELGFICPPVARQIAELRQEHSRLLQMAEELCRCLEPGNALPDFSALRVQATEFLNMLRQHHATEVDLVLECFWTDIGVGD